MVYVGDSQWICVSISQLFETSIQGQGNEEQRKKWLPLAESYQIIGAYAQTELGHGKGYIRDEGNQGQHFIILHLVC